MLIGFRLRQQREGKNLSQGDIGERIGLPRTYISRVENGHTTPSVETLEKISHALGLKLYQLLYEPNASLRTLEQIVGWGGERKNKHYLFKLQTLLYEMSDRDRQLFLHLAREITNRKREG